MGKREENSLPFSFKYKYRYWQSRITTLERFTFYLFLSFFDSPKCQIVSRQPNFSPIQLNNNGLPKRFNYFYRVFWSVYLTPSHSFAHLSKKVRAPEFPSIDLLRLWKFVGRQKIENTTALYDCVLIKFPI